MTPIEALDLITNEYNLPNFIEAKECLKKIWSLEVSAANSNIDEYGRTADWITYKVKEIQKRHING